MNIGWLLPQCQDGAEKPLDEAIFCLYINLVMRPPADFPTTPDNIAPTALAFSSDFVGPQPRMPPCQVSHSQGLGKGSNISFQLISSLSVR